MSKTLRVKYQSKEVQVTVESYLLDNLRKYLNSSKRYFLLIDKNLTKNYLGKFTDQIKDLVVYEIDANEKNKNIETVLSIINKMLELDISRNDVVITFGGGITSDIGGFASSIYKRGIEYVNIPTTLLSQVDSSLGGKCGVNYQSYKNQIGAIYHPSLILVDPIVLNTLPKNDYISGLGEIIKYGLCFDEKLFNSLFEDFNIEEVIYKCLSLKAKITSEDEFEKNLRFTLNFGHTIAHGIESFTNFNIPHGIAVSIGMLYEVKDELIKSKLQTLYNKLGIKYELDFNISEIIEYIKKDKKINNQIINLPVVKKIGKTEVEKTNINEFLRGLK